MALPLLTAIFQSTLSMRRATSQIKSTQSRHRFQSTLSMRRATERDTGSCHHSEISIHALHEESDRRPAVQSIRASISIHALHEESDASFDVVSLMQDEFQSTLSMRRATPVLTSRAANLRGFQSTLSMRRATRKARHASRNACISIHALHEESDPASPMAHSYPQYFNPRSP